MRFEVPQFIEIEDKIVGPLTWKQFVYLAGAIGLIIALFLSDLHFLIFILISLPVGALAGALAFHRINNRPFSVFLESVVKFFTHTRLYLWRREIEQEIVVKEEQRDSTPPKENLIHSQSIHTLSRKLDLPLPE